MRRFFVVLIMTLATQAYAGVPLPVTKMQNAVSGVLQAKVAKRGFAANDPRWGATLTQTGVAVASAAAAGAVVTVAAVTAPAWLTAAAGIALTTLFATAFNLAIDGTVNWYQDQNGVVTIKPSTSPPPVGSGSYWNYIGVSYAVNLQNASKLCNDYWSDGAGRTAFAQLPDYACKVSTTSSLQYQPVTYLPTSTQPQYPVYVSPGSGSTTGTPSQAAATLTSEDKAKALNTAVIAAIADGAWRNAAAQPGYGGLPYDVNDPVTDADVLAWKVANPNYWPTVGDALAPQPAPQGGTAATPFVLPNSGPVATTDSTAQPNASLNPSSQPLANLGPDPAIGAPTLEATPTAQAILAPVIGVMPTLKNFVVPSHAATCPRPTFSIFGRSIVMTSQCDLAETVRPSLFAVMAFVWLSMGLFIVLRA